MRHTLTYCLCFAMAFQPWLSNLAYGEGRRSRSQEYDHLGNVVETKTYVGQAAYDANEANYLTISETLYDEFARPIVTTDTHTAGASGVPGTETVYDALGRVIRTKRWADVTIPIVDINENGEIVGRTNTLTDNNDPNWSRGVLLSTSKTSYNKAGRIWRTDTEDENGQDQPTYYEYDAAGRQTAVTDALSHRTEYGYLGNRRTSITDALGHITQFKHDDLGRVKRTTYDDGTSTYTDFDEFSRRTVQIDQAGRLREFEYDVSGRLTAVTLPDVNDPENSDTPTHPLAEYEYDNYGNLIKQTDKIKVDADTGAIDANYARETTFTYNELNQQATRKLPNGKVEYREYNALGQLTKATDFKGQIVRYEYNDPNAPGRLSKEKYYSSSAIGINDPNLVIEITNDKLGRRQYVDVNDVDKGTFGTYSYDYDAHGRIEYIFTPDGNIRYEYSDITGRVKSVYTPAGTADTEVDYYYDELGRLAEVEAVQLNDQDANDITAYTYNTVGSLASVAYANGNLAQYTYDTLNRLTNLTNWQTTAKATALSSYQYTLSADGQRKAVTEITSEGTTNINWSYDKLNRLTIEDYNAPGSSDDFGHGYVYDLVGNRLARNVTGSDPNTEYHYNGADQLTWETTDGNTVTYGYDDNGALVSKDSNSDPDVGYSYNLRGRLSKVEIENAEIIEYLYNPDGIRVRTDVNDSGSVATTKYIIDTQNHTGYAQVLKEVGDSNTVYVTGLDVVAQATGASNPQYFLYDGHGSVRALANTAGSVLENYNYSAYGSLHNFAGTPATNLLYTGEMRDPYTTQYYLRMRWYEPLTGRFNRFDPASARTLDPEHLHKYNYGQGNPINRLDPAGLYWFFAELGKAVHREIRTMYGLEHIGEISLGEGLPGAARALLPDIMDFSLKEIAEIKPLSAYGIGAGPIQLYTYIYVANALGVAGAANKPWTTSTWDIGVRYVPLTDPRFADYFVFTIGNAFGLIFYKAVKVPREKLQRLLTAVFIASLAKHLQGVVQQLKSLASMGGAAVAGAVGALDQAAEVAFAQARAKQMAGYSNYIIPYLVAGVAMAIILSMTFRFGYAY